jgi:hypothetical protein
MSNAMAEAAMIKPPSLSFALTLRCFKLRTRGGMNSLTQG